MRKHFVPPNFDSSRFTLFGILRISALLEGAIGGYSLYLILSLLLPQDSFKKELILTAAAFMVFLVLTALSAQEPLMNRILKVVRFKNRKRSLKMRRIKPRIKLTESSKPKKVEEEVTGQVYYKKEKKGKVKKKKRKKKKRVNGKLAKVLLPKEEHWKNQKYTQEYLNIKSIDPRDGVIETQTGEFIKILELEAVNFHSLKQEEREAILLDFSRLLKTGPVNSQLKIISTQSDLEVYSDNLKKLTNVFTENSTALRKLSEEIGEQLEGFSKENALRHRYFYIFSVTCSLSNKEEQVAEAHRQIRLQEDLVRSKLGKRGVKVKEFIDGEKAEESSECYRVYEFLYSYYNRKSSKKSPFRERVERVTKDLNLTEDSAVSLESFPIKNFIAPKGIDFTLSDTVIMDGLYYSVLLITGYPEDGVLSGFLSRFSNVGAGFDFDLLIRRMPKNEIRPKLKKRNILTKTNADQMQSQSLLLPETKRIIASTDYMLRALEGDNEFFFIMLTCTLVAESYEELSDKRNWFKNLLDSYSFKFYEPRYEMENAFTLVEPLAITNNPLFEKYKRNILTDGLAGFYPYTTAALHQDDGVVLGMDMNNHSAVILNLFNPVSNMFVFGTTGFGKSFLCMLLATRLRLMQTQVFVVAPVKAHEYKKITEEVNGSFIEIGPGSKDCINVLEVRPVFRYESAGGEDDRVFTETSYLNEKIQELLRFFDLITNNTLSLKARDLLSPFLVNFYNGFGITDENSSIYIDEKKGILKEMPIISDLKEALTSSKEDCLKELAVPLSKFTEGNLKYFNSQTNVDLNNKFCLIDMSKALDYEDTRNLVLFIVMGHLWAKIRSDRTTRKAILFEEIWKMLENKETAETIREVFKTIRGYFGIAIGVTQNLEDLTKNAFEVADGILNNTLIQILMHNTPDEALKMKKRFELSSSEYSQITGAEKGEALIITPAEHYTAQIMATKTEERLFETDGNKLQ